MSPRFIVENAKLVPGDYFLEYNMIRLQFLQSYKKNVLVLSVNNINLDDPESGNHRLECYKKDVDIVISTEYSTSGTTKK